MPGDAAFQERVLIATLRLLESASGPVLADFPEDAPATLRELAAGQVCPIRYADDRENADIGTAFLREVEALQPWHDLARERRGRTTVGLSGLSASSAAAVVASFLEGSAVSCFDGLSAGATLKLVCEDLRAYYYEAAAARPGTPDADAIQNWFWRDTAAGQVFLDIYRSCLGHPDKSLKMLCATSLVPKSVLVTLAPES